MKAKAESTAVQTARLLLAKGCRHCCVAINDPTTDEVDVMCNFIGQPMLCFIYQNEAHGLIGCPDEITINQVKDFVVK